MWTPVWRHQPLSAGDRSLWGSDKTHKVYDCRQVRCSWSKRGLGSNHQIIKGNRAAFLVAVYRWTAVKWKRVKSRQNLATTYQANQNVVILKRTRMDRCVEFQIPRRKDRSFRICPERFVRVTFLRRAWAALDLGRGRRSSCRGHFRRRTEEAGGRVAKEGKRRTRRDLDCCEAQRNAPFDSRNWFYQGTNDGQIYVQGNC